MLTEYEPTKHPPHTLPPAPSECERTVTSPKDLLISLPTSVRLMRDGIRIQKKGEREKKNAHRLIISHLQQYP